MSETYKFKKKPYAHQVKALKKLIANGWGGALLMEPRTGKTKVVIDYISILYQRGRANRVIVFGPVSAMGVWEDQLKENCPHPYRLLVWDKDARKDTPLPPKNGTHLDIVIINYDALSTPGSVRGRDQEGNILRSRSRGGRFDIKRKLQAWQPHVIILDESHRIKNPSAKKTTALMSLKALPDYKVIMTGTVVTKKKRIFDVYAQWLFLNPQRFPNMNFSDFKRHYGKWTERNGYPQWLGNIREEELHKKVHLDAFSITREECYDLPRQTHQIIHIDLQESAALYDQMAEEMVAKIETGEITEASIKLVQGLRLRQITSGLVKTEPTTTHPQGRLAIVGSEKLRVVEARLEDLMEADEKVVIGALFKGDIQRLQGLCKKLKVPCFTISGGVSHTDREYARRQFPLVDGGAVFIGQPAAAGEAIDLSCASIMLWYSLTPSWVNFRQFSDRIALSERPTFFEYYLGRNTIDELLYETLLEDGNMGKKMIQSPERLLRIKNGIVR